MAKSQHQRESSQLDATGNVLREYPHLTANSRSIKPFNQFGKGWSLPRFDQAQRDGKEGENVSGVSAHLLLISQRHCPVTFRQALSIGTEHQWHMDILRNRLTKQTRKMDLSWCGFE
jgi:hypothetical protein